MQNSLVIHHLVEIGSKSNRFESASRFFEHKPATLQDRTPIRPIRRKCLEAEPGLKNVKNTVFPQWNEKIHALLMSNKKLGIGPAMIR